MILRIKENLQYDPLRDNNIRGETSHGNPTTIQKPIPVRATTLCEVTPWSPSRHQSREHQNPHRGFIGTGRNHTPLEALCFRRWQAHHTQRRERYDVNAATTERKRNSLPAHVLDNIITRTSDKPRKTAEYNEIEDPKKHVEHVDNRSDYYHDHGTIKCKLLVLTLIELLWRGIRPF